MDLINILKEMELKEGYVCGEPQSEKEIQNLEFKLNIKFPSEYRFFLQKYGYMSWFGGEIYGPSSDEYCDLLTRNNEVNEGKFPKDFRALPNDAFVFQGYLGGGYYMIFGENSDRAGEVGLFLHEIYNNEVQTWESFGAFLEDLYCS